MYVCAPVRACVSTCAYVSFYVCVYVRMCLHGDLIIFFCFIWRALRQLARSVGGGSIVGCRAVWRIAAFAVWLLDVPPMPPVYLMPYVPMAVGGRNIVKTQLASISKPYLSVFHRFGYLPALFASGFYVIIFCSPFFFIFVFFVLYLFVFPLPSHSLRCAFASGGVVARHALVPCENRTALNSSMSEGSVKKTRSLKSQECN